MQIEWTNCSEQMPPDDDTEIIVLSTADDEYHKLTGKFLNRTVPKKFSTSFGDSWTAFTLEKWNYLQQIDASNALENGDFVK